MAAGPGGDMHALKNLTSCCLLGIWMTLAPGCLGGQSGDPGMGFDGEPHIDRNSGHDAGPDDSIGPNPGPGDNPLGSGLGGPFGDAADIGHCDGERWDGPDAARSSGQCERPNGSDEADGLWDCVCGSGLSPNPQGSGSVVAEPSGAPARVEALRCDQALLAHCDIDLQAPRFCEHGGAGTCWPVRDDAESWLCRCGGEGAADKVTAQSCPGALNMHCAERCESDFGVCSGDIFQPGAYGCACTGAPLDPSGNAGLGSTSPLAPTTRAGSCGDALADGCGERCQSETGTCAIGEAGAFECDCEDGSGASQPLDGLGGPGPDACWMGLLRSCGEALWVPVQDCESATDVSSASCTALPWVMRPGQDSPEPQRYACSCDGGAAMTIEEGGCHHALASACADAIPADAGPAASGDYGALCSSGDQCSGGACYVPGTGEDAICSKRCKTDADCPDATLCAFVGGGPEETEGYCFATCRGDIYCGLLNRALDNPLYCADRVDVDAANLSGEDESGRICLQQSEP